MLVSFFFFFFRFHILVKSYGICISTSDLFHLAEYLHSPSMLLQMTGFHSFLCVCGWVILQCVYLCVCVCTWNVFVYPFIHRLTVRLFPYLGYRKNFCNEHRGARIFWYFVLFCVFRISSKSGRAALYDNSILNLKNLYNVFHSDCTRL